MNEASLKAKQVKLLRKEFPTWMIFAHQDLATHGVPDISVTGGLVVPTVWFECKYAHPELRSKGIQDVNMLKLEAAGRNAWYIVWFDTPVQKETLIIRPSVVFEGNWLSEFVERGDGIQHQIVIDFLRRMNERKNETESFEGEVDRGNG